MDTKCHVLKARTWFATMGAVAVLGALAVAAGAMSHHASKDNAVSGAAWYAEAPPPSSASVPASHAGGRPLAANDATSYAKGMSKAFHEAASKVLPSRGDDYQHPGDG